MEVVKNHNNNPFAAYAFSPQSVFFESQEKGEEIVLLLRAHPATLVPVAFLVVFLLMVPFLIVPILSLLKITPFSFLAPRQVFLFSIFWYLLVFGFALYRFIYWYFNVYILTNERIVDVDFEGILHKEISYAQLAKVQDVSPKTIGFFGTFFNYGDVFIQTAAERQEFDFHKVAMPDRVADEILKQVRQEEGEEPGKIE